jgi:hypothetical protein
MSASTKGSWWASRDGEFYTAGPYANREQAIVAGRQDFEGAGFYIVEAGSVGVSFDASRLIEDQYFENGDLFHSDGDGPDRRGNATAADAELQEMLDAWLVRHRDTFVAPTMFAWTRNKELIPTGAVSIEDVAA